MPHLQLKASWKCRGGIGRIAPKVTVTVAGMDKSMSKRTRIEVLTKLRRRYQSAGAEHKRQLLDQAQELLDYHRKSAIRAVASAGASTGRCGRATARESQRAGVAFFGGEVGASIPDADAQFVWTGGFWKLRKFCE